MIRSLLMITILCVTSCKRPSDTSENKDMSSDKRKQDEMICEENSLATYSLCQKILVDAKNINKQLNYFLLRKSDNDTILSSSITSGHVKWLNDDAIEIFQIPGNISTELTKDDIIDVYIISHNKKITKSEYLKSN